MQIWKIGRLQTIYDKELICNVLFGMFLFLFCVNHYHHKLNYKNDDENWKLKVYNKQN